MKVTMKKMRAYAQQKHLFTIVTRLLAGVLCVAGTFEFVPVLILNNAMESIHLWHIAELGALAAILLGGTLVVLSYKPGERPALAQFFLLSVVILVAGIVPFDPKALGLLLVGGAFALLYPEPRALVSFQREGRPSSVLLLLTGVFAVFLAPIALRDLHLQVIGMTIDDPHAQNLHWIGSTLLIVLLLVGGALAATKRPGWQVLGVLLGEVYCYLGVIALLAPEYPGSWGVMGGFFTAVGGGLYILLTLVIAEAQRERAGRKVSAAVASRQSVKAVAASAGSVVEADAKATRPLEGLAGSEARELQVAGQRFY